MQPYEELARAAYETIVLKYGVHAQDIRFEAPEQCHAFIIEVFKAVRVADAYHNCTNCTHWHAFKQVCTKYKQKPPATVIISGCKDFTDDIPF